MINKYSGTDKDIHERIFNYIIDGFKTIKQIPKSTETVPIISQISSSLTSMGANDQEADAASSKKDFVAKYYIVKKETKETIYWWRVIKCLKLVKEFPEGLISEGDEIFNIVSKIIRNSSIYNS